MLVLASHFCIHHLISLTIFG